MKFSEMKPKQLQKARNDLQSRLRNTLRVSRVSSLGDGGVNLEGGTFPATYSHASKELTFWGRGNRYAGGNMTIKTMVEAEQVVVDFFDEYLSGEKE